MIKSDKIEARNIENVLKSFSARTSRALVEGDNLTYAEDDAVYTINSKGEKHKIKDIAKKVKVTQRCIKLNGHKTPTDICGA